MGVPVFICKAQASDSGKQLPVNRFAEEGGKYGVRWKAKCVALHPARCYNKTNAEEGVFKRIVMNIWHDISPKRIKPEDFFAVVEISKGSKTKYELDKETGILRLDRVLYTSTHYPANYGFIPRTYAADKDPLDVLVLCSEPIQPMALIQCYPIGMITMMDNGYADDKIIAIPFEDPTYNSYHDISEIPRHVFEEMSHFFSVYKSLERKETAIDEIQDRAAAVKVIGEAIETYIQLYCR